MRVDRTYPCPACHDVLVHAPLITLDAAGIVGEDPFCPDFLARRTAVDDPWAPRGLPARLHLVQLPARLAVLVRRTLSSFREEVSALPVGLALL